MRPATLNFRHTTSMANAGLAVDNAWGWELPTESKRSVQCDVRWGVEGGLGGSVGRGACRKNPAPVGSRGRSGTGPAARAIVRENRHCERKTIPVK